MRVVVTVEGLSQTESTFKESRREIYRNTKRGLRTAGEKAILPRARMETGTRTPIAASQIVVKTTNTYGYLTCRTKKAGRTVGLLNFGGRVAATIQPKKKQAIAFGGVVVANVTGVRHYKGKHFLEHAALRGEPLFAQLLLAEIMHAFDPMQHTP